MILDFSQNVTRISEQEEFKVDFPTWWVGKKLSGTAEALVGGALKILDRWSGPLTGPEPHTEAAVPPPPPLA